MVPYVSSPFIFYLKIKVCDNPFKITSYCAFTRKWLQSYYLHLFCQAGRQWLQAKIIKNPKKFLPTLNCWQAAITYHIFFSLSVSNFQSTLQNTKDYFGGEKSGLSLNSREEFCLSSKEFKKEPYLKSRKLQLKCLKKKSHLFLNFRTH